jgi:hypothetical protein
VVTSRDHDIVNKQGTRGGVARPEQAKRALDAANFSLADVRDGLEPYLAI